MRVSTKLGLWELRGASWDGLSEMGLRKKEEKPVAYQQWSLQGSEQRQQFLLLRRIDFGDDI